MIIIFVTVIWSAQDSPSFPSKSTHLPRMNSLPMTTVPSTSFLMAPDLFSLTSGSFQAPDLPPAHRVKTYQIKVTTSHMPICTGVTTVFALHPKALCETLLSLLFCPSITKYRLLLVLWRSNIEENCYFLSFLPACFVFVCLTINRD